MEIFFHQVGFSIGDFLARKNYCQDLIHQFIQNPSVETVHVFPELFVTGYPPKDLLLNTSFRLQQKQFFEELKVFLSKSVESKKISFALEFLLPAPYYEEKLEGKIFNSVWSLAFIPEEGIFLKVIYSKTKLAVEDVFEEARYFSPGNMPPLWYPFQGKRNQRPWGIFICEDLWPEKPSTASFFTPWEEAGFQAQLTMGQITGILAINSSPWEKEKEKERKNLFSSLCSTLNSSLKLTLPFVYLNSVGAEEELVFEGQSFVELGGKILFEASLCSFSVFSYCVQKKIIKRNSCVINPLSSSSPSNVQEKIIQILHFALKQYLEKTGQRNMVLGISGGIDSSLLWAIVSLDSELKKKLYPIFMPGPFTSVESVQAVEDQSALLSCLFKSYSIKFLFSQVCREWPLSFGKSLDSLSQENLQSRLRGMILASYANEKRAIILNTSNRSELAVGYSTLYGDSVGGISLLGDLYKTEIYELAEYVNSFYGPLIPNFVLSRPPSAELSLNQKDEDSLLPYARLDPLLELLLQQKYSVEEIKQKGYSLEEIQKIFLLIKNSEFKRYQFCPIVKLRSKSFGVGRRVPITHAFAIL